MPLTNLVFSIRTVSYGPSYSAMIYSNAKEARRINHGARRKKRGYVTYSTDRDDKRLVTCLLYRWV